MNLDTLIAEHEYDPLEFDCPDCGVVTEAHLFIDRRDYGSGVTWVVCDHCYGIRWDGGMWDVGDVLERVRLA